MGRLYRAMTFVMLATPVLAAVIPGVLSHGHALTVPVQQFVIQSMGDDLTVDQQTIQIKNHSFFHVSSLLIVP